MKLLKIVFAGLSLGLVVGFVTWDTQENLSPGPLHPTHAAVAELAGTAGCAACHEQDTGMTVACASCHEEVAGQSGTGRGLHGALAPEVLARCGDCHAEHHGDATPLVTELAFARAGVPERDAYDHRHVADFPLRGIHATLSCEKCHEHADVGVLPAGATRFLGSDSSCTACHEDPHRGAFGQGCAECHGQEHPFSPPARFVHDRFALHGAHARVGCADCHPGAGPHAIASLQGDARTPARACASCHEDPHRSTTTGPAPRFDTTGASCEACHGVDTFAPATVAPAEHDRFGVELVGVHARLDCADCHAAIPEQPRRASDCGACHASPHADAFLTRAAEQGAHGCASCHAADDETFVRPHAHLEPAVHGPATGFALDAPHHDLDCAACHRPAPASFEERFPRRSADDCAACHVDPHAAAFDDGPTRGRCVACHDRHRFTPSAFGIDAHAATRFALGGAHAAVPCSACHERTVADAPPRFAGTPSDCAACHADPHGGRFDAAGLPAIVAGRTGCARCHDTDDFAAVRGSSFDHERWTGVALVGAHAEASCADCHGRRGRPDEHGRTLGRAPNDCAACHADPHGGQFATATSPAGDCGRCHDPAHTFPEHTFDHARDARFALDARHTALECGACHRTEVMGDGVARVRYRPLGTTCADCHGPIGRPGAPR